MTGSGAKAGTVAASPYLRQPSWRTAGDLPCQDRFNCLRDLSDTGMLELRPEQERPVRITYLLIFRPKIFFRLIRPTPFTRKPSEVNYREMANPKEENQMVICRGK